ncbi:hypothetical protein Cgig2_024025 [Carnegiea gigantea]|uniref:Uncharacterized protein n=1 Tax=Carnegiea gigantea TaxID=171969 RepID=A0A9Q1KHH8_9CARY|nr:hypothetical protein Cgig2_024025 [Carnegiea gigantea]
MVFDRQEGPHFASPHNDPLVADMKVASTIVRRILIDTGSSMDIIINVNVGEGNRPSGRPHFGFREARDEPHRVDSPSTTLWRQSQGKKSIGELLGSGRPPQPTIKGLSTLDGWVFIIAGLPRRGLIIITVMTGDLTTQRHDIFIIAQILVISRQILAFSTGLVTVLDIPHASFKVAFLSKVIRSQGLHELSKKFRTILVATMVTLLFSPSFSLSSHDGLGLNLGAGFLQSPICPVEGPQSSQGHGFDSPRLRQMESTSWPLALRRRLGEQLSRVRQRKESDKQEKCRERFILSSTMTTCSLPFNGHYETLFVVKTITPGRYEVAYLRRMKRLKMKLKARMKIHTNPLKIERRGLKML